MSLSVHSLCVIFRDRIKNKKHKQHRLQIMEGYQINVAFQMTFGFFPKQQIKKLIVDNVSIRVCHQLKLETDADRNIDCVSERRYKINTPLVGNRQHNQFVLII